MKLRLGFLALFICLWSFSGSGKSLKYKKKTTLSPVGVVLKQWRRGESFRTWIQKGSKKDRVFKRRYFGRFENSQFPALIVGRNYLGVQGDRGLEVLKFVKSKGRFKILAQGQDITPKKNEKPSAWIKRCFPQLQSKVKAQFILWFLPRAEARTEAVDQFLDRKKGLSFWSAVIAVLVIKGMEEGLSMEDAFMRFVEMDPRDIQDAIIDEELKEWGIGRDELLLSSGKVLKEKFGLRCDGTIAHFRLSMPSQNEEVFHIRTQQRPLAGMKEEVVHIDFLRKPSLRSLDGDFLRINFKIRMSTETFGLEKAVGVSEIEYGTNHSKFDSFQEPYGREVLSQALRREEIRERAYPKDDKERFAIMQYEKQKAEAIKPDVNRMLLLSDAARACCSNRVCRRENDIQVGDSPTPQSGP